MDELNIHVNIYHSDITKLVFYETRFKIYGTKKDNDYCYSILYIYTHCLVFASSSLLQQLKERLILFLIFPFHKIYVTLHIIKLCIVMPYLVILIYNTEVSLTVILYLYYWTRYS